MQLHRTFSSYMLKALRKLYFIAQISKSSPVSLEGINPAIFQAVVTI